MAAILLRLVVLVCRGLMVLAGLMWVFACSVLLYDGTGLERSFGVSGLLTAGLYIGWQSADWVRRTSRYPTWAARLRPGDTLVLGWPDLSAEDAQKIHKELTKTLPGIRFVVATGVTGLAVKPANPEES